MAENNEQTKNSEMQIESTVNEVNLKKIENYKDIISKLKEIINIIKRGQKSFENEENIFEYIKFPNLFPYEKLKEKIYFIFKVNNNIELYDLLLDESYYVFKKDKIPSNREEEIILKTNFYKILECLNFFVSRSLIFMNNDNNQQDKAFENFKLLIQNNIESRSILYSYINIFNLYFILKDFYSINKENLLSIEGTKKILYLINILKLQNIFSFKYLFNKKKLLFLNINNLIIELFKAYNISLKELFNVANFIVQFKKNLLPSDIIERLLNENKIKENIESEFRVFIIEKLMINYSIANNKDYKNKEILTYFNIIINNNNIISKDYDIDWNIMNKLIEKYIIEKDYEKIINYLINIKDYNTFSQHINNDYIETIVKSVPLEKIIPISELIKNKKELILYLLNNNTKKNGIKLIKAMKLTKNEYDEIYDKITMENFFYYKINTCLNDSFEILLDFALINSSTFNTCFKILIKLLNKNISNEENKEVNDDSLPLCEDIDEEIKENNNVLPEKIDRNNFIEIVNYFKNYNKRKENDKLLNIKKEKILTLIHLAEIKGYKLNAQNQKLFDSELKDKSNLNIDYNKYIPEDKCEPHDKSCIHIKTKAQKIIFVDNVDILKENIKYFRRSKYVGIDSEWSTTSFNVNYEETASILQISNYIGATILIIDLLKMRNDKEFFEVFKNNFRDKIFIGYAFNKSDIDQFFEEMRNMFINADIIDLIDLYQSKYMENAPSLKIMCEKVLGQKMCKYEQCSNWENRPLKKSQLHYAALDAIVCVSIFKVLNNNS